MNLILLSEQELASTQIVQDHPTSKILTLDGRRAEHIIDILNPEPDSTLNAGIINGNIGQLRVRTVDKTTKQLTVEINLANFTTPPPKALSTTLIIALPRPKMVRRMMQMASECGVKNIHLINSYRVDKSYWSSPLLAPQAVERTLLLGLEQSVDTQLPQVFLHKRFKPFVEDLLPNIIQGQQALVLHPYAQQKFCDQRSNKLPITAVLGPEGGFIPYEVDKLQQTGCEPVSWGPRIQRSETMLGLLLGALGAA